VCTFFYPKQSTLAGSSLLPLISSIPIYEQSGLAWHYDMDSLSTVMSFVPKVVETEAVLACSSVGALEDVQFKCAKLVTFSALDTTPVGDALIRQDKDGDAGVHQDG
jgi:hypothetical protein